VKHLRDFVDGGAPICSAIDGFRSLQMVARTRDSFDAKGGLKTIEN